MHPVLEDMFRSGVVPTPEGGAVPLQSNVQADEAEFLARVVRGLAPVTTLEIGLALGCSALAICDATSTIAGATHIVVDPRQNAKPLWGGIGLHALARAGFAARVEFHEEPSHRVLPRLEAAGRRVDFAFIDGFHTFDFALVDFFYVHRLLPVGGAVAFDDADWPAVRRVVRFAATNLPYTVHAAMPPRRGAWSAKRRAYEAVRTGAGAALGGMARVPGFGRAVSAVFSAEWRNVDRRLGLGGPCVVLRKTAEDTRRYDHFVDF
jgi:predicted O-methyltransferase YrrM